MVKQWNYSSSDSGSTGIMICRTCNKPIRGSGFSRDYKYRETEEEFINIHKECSLHDPNWNKLELEARKHKEKVEAYKIAKLAFIQKWGDLAEDDFYADEIY